jgi:hypothetical protein
MFVPLTKKLSRNLLLMSTNVAAMSSLAMLRVIYLCLSVNLHTLYLTSRAYECAIQATHWRDQGIKMIILLEFS